MPNLTHLIRAAAVSVFTLALATPALAQESELVLIEDEDDPFEEFLYEPELVLEHAREIGLSDQQRDDLIERVVEIQAAVTRRELRAATDFGELYELMEADTIDADAVLPLADALMAVETDTRRSYLALLIDIHNTLTPEQREILDEIRDENHFAFRTDE